MKKSDLANRIIAETEDLETGYASDFNKDILRSLRNSEFTGEVDDQEVKKAEELLRSFLMETWAEKPSAHKYVIGACLAQAFLFEKPMHPQEKVQYITRVEDGKERYYCRYHEENTICDFCAAARAE